MGTTTAIRRRHNLFRTTLIALVSVAGLVGGAAALAASGTNSPPIPADKGALLAQLQPSGAAVPKVPGPIAAAPTPPPPLNSRTIGTPSSLGGLTLPFDSKDFSVTNLYQELYYGKYVGVYAGDSISAADQGVIRVVVVDPRSSHFAVEDYALPVSGGGAARLVALAGERVTVTDLAGNIFLFDVPSRKFVTGG